VYTGDFKGADLEGFGKMVYANGDRYDGQWEADEREGFGTMCYGNSSSYEGLWKSGKREGMGKFRDIEGKVTEFMWVDDQETDTPVDYMDKVQKQETQKTNDGKQLPELDGSHVLMEFKDEASSFKGLFKITSFQGRGKVTYFDGETYEGDFLDSKRHGYGKMVFLNGNVYEGDWVEDEKCGKGKLSYLNGDFYEGEFESNLSWGHGRYHWKTGEVYEGGFRLDKMKGDGRLDNLDGTYYVGKFENGVYSGEGTEFSRNHKRKCCGVYARGELSQKYTLEEADALLKKLNLTLAYASDTDIKVNDSLTPENSESDTEEKGSEPSGEPNA
jgi:hypothetical protein